MLLLAALVWGMAFVAQSTAADSVGSFTFNGVRSVLASVFLLAVIGIRQAAVKPPRGELRKVAVGGAMCGLLLFVSVNFQQFGIAAYPEGAAASGRAGFLTATYVVMVALYTLITGKKMRPVVLAATVGCIAGMYMLCMSGGIGGVYLGDILVLGGAVGFAAYIMVVDHYSGLDSLKLSCIQFAVCGALSLIAAFIFEDVQVSAIRAAWLPIVYAGVFSGGVGYTLQMIGQKYAEPAVASIVMSLESVFAALAGWIILSERLSGNEIVGCALVFISVILAQTPDMVKKKT